MNTYNFLKPNISFDGELVTAKDCLTSLTKNQLTLMKNSTSEINFSAGEMIIKQGFVASHILFVESGLVRLDVENDGKLSTVSLVPKGNFIGIICSFAFSNLDFSATALEETRVKLINMEAFQSLLRENGEFALKMIQHMSTLTSNMVHWITRIADKNIEGALGIMLLEFSKVYESDKFTLPVSRIKLAEMLGFSKESTIHAISQFKNDEIIKVDGKKIEILDINRIKQIVAKA